MRATDPHLDESQLVRYIDHEASEAEQERWDAHVRACDRCSAETATLREQSATVRAWLEHADCEAASHPRTLRPGGAPRAGARGAGPGGAPVAGAWLKAAVITLLVAAPLVAVPAAREWVAERLALPGERPHARAATATTEAHAAPRITFAPAPGPFRVEIAVPQETGSLVLGRAAPGGEAVLEITGHAPWPETVVSAGSVRIVNEAGSLASYRLLVPPEVTTATVVVGGDATNVAGGAIDGTAVLPLQPTPRP
jgi:hypothetical protein